jgi:lysophospholipase L1-like esterase
MSPKRKIILAISIILLVTLSLIVVFSEQFFSMGSNERLARIACLGDSLTEISGYPEELQQLLGEGSVVGNFGVSGATVNLNSNQPYFYEPVYHRVRNFAPTTIIFMLGTNDAHDDTYEEINHFVADYENMISHMQSLSTKPKIYIVLPPPVFENDLGVNWNAYADGVVSGVRQVASNLNLTLIDAYTPLLEHADFFPDGLHPDGHAAAIMTRTIYEAIR